jgi:hypothetical protein
MTLRHQYIYIGASHPLTFNFYWVAYYFEMREFSHAGCMKHDRRDSCEFKSRRNRSKRSQFMRIGPLASSQLGYSLKVKPN